jgi:2-polyprenyl-3-methyl-5-hydroxy-6-metoxy-1,4-benzoquinol methylase
VKSPLLHALERARLLRPAYRAYEQLQALAARSRRRRAPAADGLPLPPPELIVRVAGTPDTAWFLEGGRLAAESIRMALERSGRPIEGLEALLDFGCGCGRVTRRWRGLDGVRVHGTDANEDAIAWCTANLPFGEFATNALEPPVAYADAAFDAVYALSVLTHLPEKLGLAWRDELRRVVRPGGILLVSTHGASYRERMTDGERARFDAGELVVRWESAAGTNLCSAYHPEQYLRGPLADGFELVEHVPRGAAGNPHQDLTVLKRS